MKAVIVCNGSIKDYDAIKDFINKGDYIISVDGGASHLRKMGIIPDILLGDFDSANEEDIEYFKTQGIQADQFSAEKDMTDSELAIEKALEKGVEEIVFIGAVGTRFDHSMSNIFLLKKLMDVSVKACIVDEHNYIYMFNETFTMPKKEGYKLSLIPVSDKVTGVTTKGLKYPLNNATMSLGTSWGVSNEFYEDIATVTLGEGILLVCLSRD
ncbi:MAG: thiamine pyrophosphokinae [Eubacterium sp.]|jgi:thiamine pyrophosphokinase|nr:thiamine pyrophosphokinae [Eubacterium sp.]